MSDLSDELKNVIRKYQEEQKDNSNKSNPIRKKEEPNNSSSIRAGHQRPMSRIIKDDISGLTTEERKRAGGMLDALERNSGHNRGRGRGR